MKTLAFIAALLFSATAFGQAIDTIGGFPQPSGAAGGVLSGTYPNPGFAVGPVFTGTNPYVNPNATFGVAANDYSEIDVLAGGAGVGSFLGGDHLAAYMGTLTGLPVQINTATSSTQFQINHVASANHFIEAFGSNGAAPGFTTNLGDITVGAATGNVRVGSGSVPTIAGGACGTGANGTIAAGSRANAGTVQIGASATTVCTVVFASAMTTAPVCVISPANATAAGATVLAYVSANTVNGFVITGAVLASGNFNYHCL